MRIMIKGSPKFILTLMLILLCSCAASSSPMSDESINAPASYRSAGCGTIQKGTGNFKPMQIHVLNQNRKYHLRVPSSYDSNRAYPLIFRWHGAGGNALSGGLGIEFSAKDDAIVVSADGLNNFWHVHADSVDLPFFDNMLETISSQYCIDRHRVFSYGFSIGGSFSNLLACERSNVLRASAAIASGLFSNTCKGQVATWLLHDVNDDVVVLKKGKAVLERVITANGCSTKAVDEGNGCLSYQGCEAAPVVWCESKGLGHNIRGDFAPAQVWKFFQTLH
jgi:polyhydroxybutyrate depolymerase